MKNQLISRLSMLLCILVVTSFTSTIKAQTLTWYQDLDGDGWGNPNVSMTSATQPTGYVLNDLDCNDGSINGSTWQNVDSTHIADSSKSFNDRMHITISDNNVPYIAYNSFVGSKRFHRLMKYDGSKFVELPAAFNTKIDLFHTARIATGLNDTLYLLYSDPDLYNRLTVKKFNGTSWVTVGPAGFSIFESIIHNDIAIHNGVPYVAFVDYDNNNSGLSVMKFDGTYWQYVGSRRFVTNSERLENINIEIDASGNIYVAAEGSLTTPNVENTYLWKYSGSSWGQVGNSISLKFSTANFGCKFALAPDGTPHFAYNDNDKISVRKYNGSSWVLVGNARFSDSTIRNALNLSIDVSGRLFVTYSDDRFATDWPTVKMYDGNTWETIGDPSVSNTSLYDRYISMDVGPDGIPYVIVRYYHVSRTGADIVAVRRLAPIGGVGTTGPDQPTAMAAPDTISQGDSSLLSVTAGNLNDATAWIWYTGSCGGSKVTPSTTNATGSTISVKPLVTTTYYVRGEGGCMPAGACDSVIVVVKPTSANSIQAKDIDVALFPNPNNGSFTLQGKLNNTNDDIQLSVLNSVGQVVFNTNVQSNNGNINEQVQLPANTPSGIYTLTINIDGQSYYKRISIL